MNSLHKLDSFIEEAIEPDETSSEPALSIGDVALGLTLSPATVRRYIADHGACIGLVRDGRSVKVLLSSFPVLARIRDLRQRKTSKPDIDRLIGAPMGLDVFDGVPGQGGIEAVGSSGQDMEVAFEALRKDFVTMKQELRDNELVVRQSFSTILFLIEKFSRETEYHASEERIANTERDRRLKRANSNSRASGQKKLRGKGFLTTLASLFMTPTSSR